MIRDAICERLITKTYTKGSMILYPGSRVDNIVFIIQGEMRETICLDEYPEAILSEGDFVGGTLLSWCIEDSSVRKGWMLSMLSINASCFNFFILLFASS